MKNVSLCGQMHYEDLRLFFNRFVRYVIVNSWLGLKVNSVCRPGMTNADGSIICTALGGDHNKDPSSVQVMECRCTELVVIPLRNYITDLHNIVSAHIDSFKGI